MRILGDGRQVKVALWLCAPYSMADRCEFLTLLFAGRTDVADALAPGTSAHGAGTIVCAVAYGMRAYTWLTRHACGVRRCPRCWPNKPSHPLCVHRKARRMQSTAVSSALEAVGCGHDETHAETANVSWRVRQASVTEQGHEAYGGSRRTIC